MDNYTVIVLIFVGIPGIIFCVFMYCAIFHPDVIVRDSLDTYRLDDQHTDHAIDDKSFERYSNLNPSVGNMQPETKEYLISEVVMENGSPVIKNRIVDEQEYLAAHNM